MKKIILVLILPALMFAACKSGPSAKGAPEIVEKTAAYQILDHKTMKIGQSAPEWVTAYIADGSRGVENLPQFEGKYVFVGTNTGVNKDATIQWASNYTVASEISRMVSTRVEAKFVGAAAGSPNDRYGQYFEEVVKNVSTASFTGARKENDFWFHIRYFNANGKTVNREVYEVYVLFTIDKALLEQQLTDVINGVNAAQPITPEQRTAVERVKEAFYEGF